MERFTLNGLISDTVREAVNLTNQLHCLLELGTTIEDGIYVNNHENRDLLRQAREALWGVERAVRGCDVVTSTEQQTKTLKDLVVNVLESYDFTHIAKEAVEDTVGNLNWSDYDVVTSDSLEGYITEYLSGVDWSEWNLATEDEVDSKIDDFVDEDKVREIIDEVIESLEVTTRIRRGF